MSVYGIMGTSASGMSAQADRMGAVADNIANISTTGYKSATVQFSTLIPEVTVSQYETGAVAALAQRAIDQQGSFTYTNSPTDLAINGDGFFVVSGPRGEIALTRAGSFAPDNTGKLQNAAGFTLLGYDLTADLGATVVNGTAGLQPINIDAMSLRASASSEGEIQVNLPSSSGVVQSADLPSLNQSSANFTAKTSVVAYNNLGGEVLLDLYFSKTAGHTWEITSFDRADASSSGGFPYSAGPLATATIEFNPLNGELGSSSPRHLSVPISNGQLVDIDLSKSSQLDSGFSIQNVHVNGNKPAAVNGIQVSQNGILTAIYDNGVQIPSFRIPLGHVTSPTNMTALSGNVFVPGPKSGAIQISEATAGGTGQITSGALEQSTVDLAGELSSMIEAQRSYTANSRVFQTGAELMDVIVNLRR